MSFDMSNVNSSKIDGVYRMIANLANFEQEVDNEMLSLSNPANTESNINSHDTLSYEPMEN